MNEPKRAAVIKRGTDRDHRDLFASRPADMGSVRQTMHPAPLAAGVAARSETSVLFTVEAIKDAARGRTPEPAHAPPPSSFIPADDDGVIDLKSLASTPPRGGAAPVAPLFSEAPLGAFAADVGGSGQVAAISLLATAKGKRLIAGVAAAAVAIVLMGIGIGAAFRGEEPVARTASAAAPPVAPPLAAVVASPTPVIAPVAISSASGEDDDETPTATVKRKGKSRGGKAKASGKATMASAKGKSGGVSKPATKSVDKCRCKGDFNCILRCTAKGH